MRTEAGGTRTTGGDRARHTDTDTDTGAGTGHTARERSPHPAAATPQQRLYDVVSAALDVAAERAEAGAYTAEVGRTLSAVVARFGERLVTDAEFRGFADGWREAVAGAGTPPATGHRPGRPDAAADRTGPPAAHTC